MKFRYLHLYIPTTDTLILWHGTTEIAGENKSNAFVKFILVEVCTSMQLLNYELLSAHQQEITTLWSAVNCIQ